MIVNTCSCGKKYTLDEWKELKDLGDIEMNDGQMPCAYNHRDCSCGSTRSIGLDADGNYYPDGGE